MSALVVVAIFLFPCFYRLKLTLTSANVIRYLIYTRIIIAHVMASTKFEFANKFLKEDEEGVKHPFSLWSLYDEK